MASTLKPDSGISHIGPLLRDMLLPEVLILSLSGTLGSMARARTAEGVYRARESVDISLANLRLHDLIDEGDAMISRKVMDDATQRRLDVLRVASFEKALGRRSA